MNNSLRKQMMYNTSPKVRLIRALLIALSIALTLYFFYLVVPLILNHSSDALTFGNNLPITNPDKFTAVLNITDNIDGNKIVELAAIIVPSKSKLGGKSICVNQVTIINQFDPQEQKETKLWDIAPPPSQVYVISTGERGRLENITSYFSDICASDNSQAIEMYQLQYVYNLEDAFYNLEDANLHRTTSNTSFSSSVTTITPIFFYPFDRYKIQLYVWFKTPDGVIHPDIIGKINSPNWQVSSTYKLVSSDLIPMVEIDFFRPSSLQALVFILLTSLFLIVVFSVFIKDVATYFGVLLGVLLGLDGLRSIMKSPEATGTTMIDSFFLSFYILMGLTLFLRFVIFPLWRLTDQNRTRVMPPKLRPMKKNRNS